MSSIHWPTVTIEASTRQKVDMNDRTSKISNSATIEGTHKEAGIEVGSEKRHGLNSDKNGRWEEQRQDSAQRCISEDQQLDTEESKPKTEDMSLSSEHSDFERLDINSSRVEQSKHAAASLKPVSTDQTNVDPTPMTPRSSASPSRASLIPVSNSFEASNAKDYDGTHVTSFRHNLDTESDAEEPDKHSDKTNEELKSEIQNIMDQFNQQRDNLGEQRVRPTRKNLEGPLLGDPMKHPPRKSSLESIGPTSSTPNHEVNEKTSFSPSFMDDLSQMQEATNGRSHTEAPSIQIPQPIIPLHTDPNDPSSPKSFIAMHKPPPPDPDPDPDLPFDFHRFLEQLRHRTADPVAGFLRSFLLEFGKKQWMVHEQVKIISDFLAFISNKMAQCEVWRGASDAEFDNAKEGMEKLVMNRLYSQTFSPAIPPLVPLSGTKGKRKTVEKLMGSGRRGQHQEDIERDEILGQKIRIYGWIQEEHLDIPPVGDTGKRFLTLAQQEILKIKTYRAPRDKVICVLNCCKVIIGLLRNSKSADTSADSFVPLLIYVVLRANPDHLVSNVQYVLRFRNQDKLGGEAGYYLSSLMGAIQFIENLDRTTLTVSDEDFEKNVEAAVSVIAERHEEDPESIHHGQISEKSGPSEPQVMPLNSGEAEYIETSRITSSRDASSHSAGSDVTDEKAAVSSLLRTIQRPLSTIGRIFSEDSISQQRLGNLRSLHDSSMSQGMPQKLTPGVFQPPRSSNEQRRSLDESPGAHDAEQQSHTNRLNAEDAAARQASAEAAEIQRIQVAEHHDVVETLAGMFPDLDRDVIDDVVRMKEGRVGLAVDACLALSS